MKLLLNKTRRSSVRFYLIDGSMGSYGEPANHANHKYQVANGIDRGHGYQGYMAISYALNECTYLPAEAKAKIKEVLKKENLIY